ncbi:MAG: hypothetical protein JNK34_00670 [Tabrizicola sp.]|nr:hypothetical protein [Tabrizicola sp.]
MTRFLVPALLALSALPAAAQDSSGLSYSGEVKLEYLDANSSYWSLAGDAALTWRSGGLFGFDAAVDTVVIDRGSDFTNYWAAAVLSFGSGELAIGAPRPVFLTQEVQPKFGTSRLVDLELSFVRGGFARIASAEDPGMTPGITYTHKLDSVTFAAGYHRIDNSSTELNIYEGLMRYDGGATQYFISAEHVATPSDDATFLSIGARHDADRFDLGATLSKFKTSDTTLTARLYGSYDIMPGLSIGADYLAIQDTDDVYSLGARYEMDSGLFVEGGVSELSGSNEVYDIGVGFSF